MDIDAGLAKQYEYFDRLGNINDYGKMQFWKTLDTQLREFSFNRENFKPQPVVSRAQAAQARAAAFSDRNHHSRHHDNNRIDPQCYRMPPPPPC